MLFVFLNQLRIFRDGDLGKVCLPCSSLALVEENLDLVWLIDFFMIVYTPQEPSNVFTSASDDIFFADSHECLVGKRSKDDARP